MSTLPAPAITGTPTPAKQDIRYLLALLAIEGIGTITAKQLVAYAGSAEAVFGLSEGRMLKIPGIGEKTATTLREAAKRISPLLDSADRELAWCHKQGVQVTAFWQAGFPDLLKTELTLPVILFQKGALDLNAQQAVAIVGTRKATDYGRRQAAHFAQVLAAAGLNVVSGLAYGIDAEAHRATLAAHGKTTAVLGHGLDRIYPPQHVALAKKILDHGGALLSEYRTGVPPDAVNFPERNRIIAGLSRAVLVMEAGEKGGALITGRLAFEMNREVYALPGSVESKSSIGCHMLIQRNIAKLVTTPEEVLQELALQNADMKAGKQGSLLAQTPDLHGPDATVYNALNTGGRTLDELALATALPVAQLVSLLLDLEFKGLVRQLPGRKFVRV